MRFNGFQLARIGNYRNDYTINKFFNLVEVRGNSPKKVILWIDSSIQQSGISLLKKRYINLKYCSPPALPEKGKLFQVFGNLTKHLSTCLRHSGLGRGLSHGALPDTYFWTLLKERSQKHAKPLRLNIPFVVAPHFIVTLKFFVTSHPLTSTIYRTKPQVSI